MLLLNVGNGPCIRFLICGIRVICGCSWLGVVILSSTEGDHDPTLLPYGKEGSSHFFCIKRQGSGLAELLARRDCLWWALMSYNGGELQAKRIVGRAHGLDPRRYLLEDPATVAREGGLRVKASAI